MAAALPLSRHATLPAAERIRTPRIREAETIQPLKGHSGAQVLLCLKDGASLVRKTAGSKAQNQRLKDQIAKQRLLAAHGLPFPRVLAEGIDPTGLAYAEMDYVPARTVASIIAAGSPFDQNRVLKEIRSALTLFRMTAGGTLDPGLFTRKIDEIVGKMSAKAGSLAGPIAAMGRMLSARDWNAIPESACHGDMTLENILIGQRRTVFIDCDETFASSYWMDLSKLFQDVDGHWCLRELHLTAPGGTAMINAVERLHRLAGPLHALAAHVAPAFAARKAQLTALNLFPTLPYTKSKKQLEFVLSRMQFVLSAP